MQCIQTSDAKELMTKDPRIKLLYFVRTTVNLDTRVGYLSGQFFIDYASFFLVILAKTG